MAPKGEREERMTEISTAGTQVMVGVLSEMGRGASWKYL